MSRDRLRERLEGVAFTTPVPFSEDGSDVLVEELRRNARSVADAGGRLFVPCGNTGEYYSLSADERIRVVEETVEAVGEAGTVVAGAGGSTKTVTELLAAYEAAGADGAMIMHPSHAYLHRQGLVEYYREIADSTDLELVLYKRGPELSLSVLSTVAEHENVAGVKFAVNDVDEFSRTVRETPDDVAVLNGIAERFAPAFAVEGADGFTTGIGNFVPEASLALWEAIREADWERATEIRDLLRPYEALRDEAGADNSLPAANNVPAVKYGLELAGLYGGPVRAPIVGLTEEDEERAERYYRRIESADL